MDFLVIMAVVVLFLVLCGFRIVKQQHEVIVERLGKYHKTMGAGVNLIIPIVDRPVKNISLKEQVYDFPPQSVITKDNVTMQIDSVVFAHVFDSKLYTYGAERPIDNLQNLAATTLRSIIGDMELDATLASREEINGRMQQVLDEATDAWGLKVTRVEIKNIQPPREIEEVMTTQMKAERERRQTALEARAHREAVVTRAEGDKQAKVLAAEAERDAQIALAEGRAKSIRLVYEAEAEGIKRLNEAQISSSVLKLKGIEALKDVSNGRATKIYMPTDLTNIISELGVVGEALGIGDATSIDKTAALKPELEKDPCINENSSAQTKAAYYTTANNNQMGDSGLVLNQYEIGGDQDQYLQQ